MWSKTVNFSVACLWLLTIANFQSDSTALEVTQEDIRTVLYSFGHSLRENVDKLERHERREKQSSDQIQNMLLTIVNKQREQFADNKVLETTLKGLEESIHMLTDIETNEEAASRSSTKSMLESLEQHMAADGADLKSILKAEKQATNRLYESLGSQLTTVSEQVKALQSRLDSLERAPKSQVSNDAIYELLQKMAAERSAPRPVGGEQDPAANTTWQLVQETKHAVVEAVQSLTGRLDDSDRRREACDATIAEMAKSTRAFQADAQKSFQSVLDGVKTLSDVEKVLVQTADHVLDTKRRIEYGTHQILTDVTAAVNDRSKELNESVNAAVGLAVDTVLSAQSAGMANLSVKIETEISQVWRQIGIMYQTLTDSAATLTALHNQTDAFVNSTAVSVNGMNSKVSAIGGRMTEVDENLNYLLGRLSLVTQEFKEIKIGLGDALESIRVGLQTVQGNKPTVDLGPGPNPIDDEPLSAENINLSKTVYTVS
ncbi:uncharacterized protein LOC112693875 [Sipha flava]|uniref:Uncharacterized protein LOC112693875 n=3 Tax=Sipha flava TaxID=143950 RepID=A0A8B8GQL8_9HEMI|nr:uncharacterized protein LOC112693875 [Sipha flava]XP_025424906.1 uncharacterized protein LOC112693875 [Sipha flava]